MSRERISRDDWSRALSVFSRGIDETTADLENADEEQDRKISLLLESAWKVYKRLLDDKVLR